MKNAEEILREVERLMDVVKKHTVDHIDQRFFDAGTLCALYTIKEIILDREPCPRKAFEEALYILENKYENRI